MVTDTWKKKVVIKRPHRDPETLGWGTQKTLKQFLRAEVRGINNQTSISSLLPGFPTVGTQPEARGHGSLFVQFMWVSRPLHRVENEGREPSWSYSLLSSWTPLGNLQHMKENQPQIHQPREEGWSLQKPPRAMLDWVRSKCFLKQLIKFILHSMLEIEDTTYLLLPRILQSSLFIWLNKYLLNF